MLFDEDYDEYEEYDQQQTGLSEHEIFVMKVRLAEINSEMDELNRKSSMRLEAYRPGAIFAALIAGFGTFFGLMFIALLLGPYFGPEVVTIMFLAPDPFISIGAGAGVYSYIARHTVLSKYQELDKEKKEIELALKHYYGHVPDVERYRWSSYLG
jgi:hypothetical protein